LVGISIQLIIHKSQPNIYTLKVRYKCLVVTYELSVVLSSTVLWKQQ